MQDQSQSVLANGPGQCADSSFADMRCAEICSNRDLSLLMKAHDTLSGAIAKRAGPKGIWASGSTNACSLGAAMSARPAEPIGQRDRGHSGLDRVACAR